MQSRVKREASKPKLTIVVEGVGESWLKDIGTFGAWFGAAWLANEAGLPQTYVMGMAILVIVAYLIDLFGRLGLIKDVAVVSAPPEDVGEIIEHWLEATADDHEDQDTTK